MTVQYVSNRKESSSDGCSQNKSDDIVWEDDVSFVGCLSVSISFS